MKLFDEFRGEIGTTYPESTPWFPERAHPGEDAPNVVVILLDDTTSALDAETEARILQALRSTRSDLTMVMVASRPSTISYADHVIVMDVGRVVAQGTHDELRQTSETYRSLVEAPGHA